MTFFRYMGISSGGGPSSKEFAPRIVVGNASAGDTSADCDILDTGNGLGIQLALTQAASLADKADIWVRPGTYDFAAGGPTAVLVVGADVALRGAGRGCTVISGRAAGERGLFDIAANASLENFTINVPTASGSHPARVGLIGLTAPQARIYNVDIAFSGTVGTESLTAAVHASASDSVVIDTLRITGVRRASSANAFSAVRISGASTGLPVSIKNVSATNVDIGCHAFATCQISDCAFSACTQGVRLDAALYSNITNAFVSVDGAAVSGLLRCGTFTIDTNGASFVAVKSAVSVAQAAGEAAFIFTGTSQRNTLSSSVAIGTPTAWSSAVDVASSCSNTLVLQNQFWGSAIVNASGTTELAHNL